MTTTDSFLAAVYLGPTVALGVGLLIGIERERRKGQGPQRAFAGVRTFALVALAGSLAQLTESNLLVACGALLVIALSAVSYWRLNTGDRKTSDPGVTTELALFVTYLIGVTAVPNPALAGAAGVIVAILLAARNRLHEFSRDILTTRELRDGLMLAGAALVILPLLPDHGPAWAPALNAHRIWSLVVAIMLVQAAGHVALRVFGSGRGLALSGLVSGFVSSTATIAALGSRARQEPGLMRACVAGAALSNVATVLLLAMIALLVNVSLMRVLAIPLLASGLAAVAFAGLAVMRNADAGRDPPPDQSAFRIAHVMGFALLMTGVTAAVSLAEHTGWVRAAEAGIALAGFADAHAAGSAAFSLASLSEDRFDPALLMLAGLSTNTVSKCVVAAVAGGRPYALRLIPALVGIAGAGWLGWWLAR
jgi:uncharacterized membrane protein (DUF4010 family)